ncbi:MAG: hypothetical protein ABI120_10720 [Gemmatimonadaceae bacterium]
MSKRQRLPLSTIAAQWAKIAAEIERGCTLPFDDYLNDVDLRHSIACRLTTTTEIADSLERAGRRALWWGDERDRRLWLGAPECD